MIIEWFPHQSTIVCVDINVVIFNHQIVKFSIPQETVLYFKRNPDEMFQMESTVFIKTGKWATQCCFQTRQYGFCNWLDNGKLTIHMNYRVKNICLETHLSKKIIHSTSRYKTSDKTLVLAILPATAPFPF